MGFKWLDFKITNRCNNNCIYCGHQDTVEKPESIPWQNISDTLYDALGHGFTHYAFLGGEPSIRENLSEILKPLQITDSDSIESIMVITNMHKYNEKMYRDIFKAKSKHAQIVASVDSLKEPNYKNQKINKVLQYIDKIQKISIEYQHLGKREVHVHSVISRENISCLYDHVKFFKGKNIEVSMALVEPFKIIENPRKYNEFSYRDMQLILTQLDQLKRDGLLNWANNVLKEYIIRYIKKMECPIFECTAGLHHVIIESDGNIYPCLTESYTKGLKFGNILTNKFRDIYNKMSTFHCESAFKQTCWDHFLWTKLDHQGALALDYDK